MSCLKNPPPLVGKGIVNKLKSTIRESGEVTGEEKIIQEKNIKELPFFACSLKAQSFKIKFPPESDLDLQVGSIMKKEDMPVGTVENVEETMKTPDLTLLSSLCYAKKGIQGIMQIVYSTGYHFRGCFASSEHLPKIMLFELPELQHICQNVPEDSLFMPEPGQIVVGKTKSGNWLRGFVARRTVYGYVIGDCLYGNLERVQAVRTVPTKYRMQEYFAIEGCINQSKSKFEIRTDVYQIEVLDVEKETVLVQICDDNGITSCTAQLRPWNPPHTYRDSLRYLKLIEGSCIIRSFASCKEMYVMPCNSDFCERHNILLKDIARHCYLTPCLDSDPKMGDIVACRYIEDEWACTGVAQDKWYYRAQVLGMDNSSFIVHYIDYGGLGQVKREDMKPLSKALEFEFCCVILVSLVCNEKPLNEKCFELIENLTKQETELNLKIVDHCTNHVNLFFKDGTDFATKLDSLLNV